MDWDKVIQTVGDMARKTFALAMAVVLIMGSVAGVYIAAIALWWVVKKAQQALGV